MHISNYSNPTNTMPINIIVCSRQYDSPSADARGFGDIAHGVRVINLVKNKLPNSNLRFILEYSGEKSERKVIKTIISSNKINHIILSRELSKLQQSAAIIIAQNWIDSATAIIHGPSSIITYINWSELSKSKMLSFAEYENNYGYYEFANHVIERTGISKNLLHITDYQGITADYKFESSILNQLFANIQIYNSIIFLCYTGSGTEDFFIPLLAIILNLDKSNSRDLYLITPTAFKNQDTEIFQTIVNTFASHSYISIRYITANEKKVYKYVNGGVIKYKKPKIIYYVTPFPLDEIDIKKINLITNYIVSTGDISFSDAISANKIPLMHKRKQRSSTIHTEVAITNFYKEQENIKLYIDSWKAITEIFATPNFKRFSYINKMFEKLLSNDISCLATEKWQEIEKEFTNSMISNNKLEQIILNYINNKVFSLNK